MSRFSPTVEPYTGEGLDRLLMDAYLTYRQVKRQDAQDAAAAEDRALERYQAGVRDFDAPPTIRDIPAPSSPAGPAQPGNAPNGIPAPAVAGIVQDQPGWDGTFASSPHVGTTPGTTMESPTPRVPGAFLPGIGFGGALGTPPLNPHAPDPRAAMAGTAIGGDVAAGPPPAMRADPRYVPLHGNAYLDTESTPEARERRFALEQREELAQMLVSMGLPPEQAQVAAMRPDLIDNLIPEPIEESPYTLEMLTAAGLSPEDAAIGLANPDFVDDLLRLYEQRRANRADESLAASRERRISAGGGGADGGISDAQTRMRALDFAAAVVRRGIPMNGPWADEETALAKEIEKAFPGIGFAAALGIASSAMDEVETTARRRAREDFELDALGVDVPTTRAPAASGAAAPAGSGAGTDAAPLKLPDQWARTVEEWVRMGWTDEQILARLRQEGVIR